MDLVHGFKLLEEQEIQEIASTVKLWRHEASGAELLSLVNEDENKVFGVSFRTPPSDSTGVAHILEHSVLCGSEKYPLKEPFVELLKGSLKTFLNAFTFPDKTCYPVASANVQDFYNLIDVYLDAVFHPLIPEHVFRQEGWRLEPAPDAPQGYAFKGVVYNEMKGAYSSPDAQLHEKAQQTLFPDTLYGLDSGGDPANIPDLTYEDFKRFHDTCYHPSNARFFFHGNDPEEKRLELIDACIAPFGKLDVDTSVPLQPAMTEPATLTLPYPADAQEEDEDHRRERCLVTVSWLFPQAPEVEDSLVWQMLETILVGLPGAPLRKALLDSGLGEDMVGIGLETELAQSYFSTGLKGIAKENAERVEALIISTLEGLANDGLPAELVEAAVNSLEFDLRENNTGRFPRGLNLMLRSLTQWLYDKSPFAPLAFAAPLNSVKERLAAGQPVFEDCIRTLLLRNPHRVTLLLEPDDTLAQTLLQEEQKRVEQKLAELDEAGKKHLAEEADVLRKLQETPDSPDALATLPRLTIDDLPRENVTIAKEERVYGGVKTLLHDIPTNGLLYLDLAFDLLPTYSKRPLLKLLTPLFCRALLEMGTSRRDYVELSTRIARKTGGIDADPFVSAMNCSGDVAARLIMRGKSTLLKVGDLTDIFQEILCEASFADASRLVQLVQEELAGMEEKIAPMGHRIAMLRAETPHSKAAAISEALQGASQLLFLRRLTAVLSSKRNAVEALQEALEHFRSMVLQRDKLVCNVTTPEKSMRGVAPVLESFFNALPKGPYGAAATNTLEELLGDDFATPAGKAYHLGHCNEAMSISSQINFVAKASNLYTDKYQFHGSALVASRLLSTGWLWDRVRVQGGAYGAFCNIDRLSGVVSMGSYRDPNLLTTIEAFDASAKALRAIAKDRSVLESGIIGTVGALDEHLLPDAKGLTSLLRWLVGDTDENRQTLREQVLEATAEDIEPLVEALEVFAANGTTAALGSREALKQLESHGWNVTRLL